MRQKRTEKRWHHDGRGFWMAAMCETLVLAVVAVMAITFVIGADRYVANLKAGQEVAAK